MTQVPDKLHRLFTLSLTWSAMTVITVIRTVANQVRKYGSVTTQFSSERCQLSVVCDFLFLNKILLNAAMGGYGGVGALF